MTKRMVTAVSNPRVNVLGHCTGRLVTNQPGHRPQSDFDARAVFEACAEHETAVRDQLPSRALRSPDELIRMAKIGCLFSIDSDAHAPGQLDMKAYGASAPSASVSTPTDHHHLGRRPPQRLGPGCGDPHGPARPPATCGGRAVAADHPLPADDQRPFDGAQSWSGLSYALIDGYRPLVMDVHVPSAWPMPRSSCGSTAAAVGHRR